MMTRMLCLSIAVLILAQRPATAQWYQQQFPPIDGLWRVSFSDENTGWILSTEGIYRTTDGGVNWALSDSTGGCCAMQALDQNTIVYASWTDGIRRTSDGGATWEWADTMDVLYEDFEFVTPDIGYAAGGTEPDNNSILRKTTDGGATWNTISIIPQDNYGEFGGISFVSEMLGWGITYAGTVYKTTDGGANWSISDSTGLVLSMRDIDFTDANMGWAVGGLAGTMHLWRTTDGGDSWIKEDRPGSSLRAISMLDSEVGWFIGDINFPPYVARTDDGGLSWVTQDIFPSGYSGFEGLCMVNENIGWAVSVYEGVYKTTNGGVTFVGSDDELPGSFSLSQNYPNPFNAQTQIRFEIRDVGYVRLEIFDPLGQKVATLVDEELAPGSYARNWDAAGVASGIYFYKLQTGSYVATRKLVLIR